MTWDPLEVITSRKGPMRPWAKWFLRILLSPFLLLYLSVAWVFALMSVLAYEKNQRLNKS